MAVGFSGSDGVELVGGQEVLGDGLGLLDLHHALCEEFGVIDGSHRMLLGYLEEVFGDVGAEEVEGGGVEGGFQWVAL